MIFLTDSEVEQLLPPAQVVSIMEAAMRYDETHTGSVPQRMHLQHDQNTVLVMPAVGENFYGTKVVSVYPENTAAGKPMISGYYVLNSRVDGAPVAVMSAEKLTAIRTGGIGGAAARALANSTTTVFGVIGCGVQGLSAAKCILSVLPVKNIVCFSRTEKSCLKFKSAIQKSFPNVEVQLCENSEAVINQAEVIVTATNSPKPVLNAKRVKTEGKVFIAMGSYRPQMQELPDEVFQQCREIIIDAVGIKKETGDILNPISNGWVKDEDVFTLGKILNGERESISKTKVFKSAGYALFDLFAAEEIYKRALKQGVGRKIEFK